MPNEVKVSRRLFISCILILCIIFTGIVVAQKNYYENKIKEIEKNNNGSGQFVIVDQDTNELKNITAE